MIPRPSIRRGIRTYFGILGTPSADAPSPAVPKNIRDVDQNTHAAGRNIHAADGNIHAADGNIHAADGNIHTADGNIHAAGRNIHAAGRNIVAVGRNIVAAGGEQRERGKRLTPCSSPRILCSRSFPSCTWERTWKRG